VLNKLGLEQLVLVTPAGGMRLSGLTTGTRDYFRKLSGYDTLRLILARRAILVEGPSDELIVQRAYLDVHGQLPIEDGIDVISVGLAFKRFLELAVPLARSTAVVRDNEPVAVLGALAAQRLGIDRVFAGERIWLGGQWFYVAGILNPAVLAPDLDTSVLVGYPAAQAYLGSDGHLSTIYVRAQVDQVDAVQELLAATASPQAPSQVNVSQPSQAPVARADGQSALNGLFLGLGAVALLVGAVGVANIMIISVLERRSEIGLRRVLGATRSHIRVQFLSEAILLAKLGGAAGVSAGALATAMYAAAKGWATVIPPLAWAGGLGAAIAIGALAGLLPALKQPACHPPKRCGPSESQVLTCGGRRTDPIQPDRELPRARTRWLPRRGARGRQCQ
jgi:hypothetical protein